MSDSLRKLGYVETSNGPITLTGEIGESTNNFESTNALLIKRSHSGLQWGLYLKNGQDYIRVKLTPQEFLFFDQRRSRLAVIQGENIVILRINFPRGRRGCPGIQGISGSTGVQGISGSSGLSGSPGVEGISGSPGLSGSPGVQGISGAPGLFCFVASSSQTGSLSIPSPLPQTITIPILFLNGLNAIVGTPISITTTNGSTIMGTVTTSTPGTIRIIVNFSIGTSLEFVSDLGSTVCTTPS